MTLRTSALANQIGVNEFQKITNAIPDKDGVIICPVVPLRGLVIFPNVISPITTRNPRAMSAIQAALVSRKTVIGIALRDPNVTDVQFKDLYGIGTEIALSRIIRTPDDSRNVLAQGRRRPTGHRREHRDGGGPELRTGRPDRGHSLSVPTDRFDRGHSARFSSRFVVYGVNGRTVAVDRVVD